MIREARYIKKLVGWCPYAKTTGVEPRISSANFEEYVRSGGEEAGSPKVPSQFSRFFSRKGVDSEFFFSGILFSLLLNSLCWKKLIQECNALVKKPDVRYVSKIVLFYVFLSLIWFSFLPFMVFRSYHMPPSINSQSMYSFIAGIWILTMWGTSLQLIYWEKKNHMKICTAYENGFQKTYTIGEKEGEM
ncbi:hypothetical protein MSHOH_0130 [Methanosarcina horonobensis HB-1 = JCM 15518]|uniref:DUF1673 domain-containing protein n=1 Tax=Methanosarcina horonobensis HB-1 = JCM 15518 TaxID=1434110 RepID=A0A0E3SBG3_9EURY|nr:DUF1673 family protein [Methanosarcina horonobensis]AKB76613.1 hypothetical protein MSHOH_0130 [Methanosarcina horonobensis HB-1 = JCM 15518]